MIEIRKALREDADQIWDIIHPIISKGDTYVFDPKSSKEKMLAYWFGSDKHTYVAVIDKKSPGLL